MLQILELVPVENPMNEYVIRERGLNCSPAAAAAAS